MADPKEKTKEELKAELEAADKPVSGTKDELVERVEDLSREHRPDVFVVNLNRPKG